LGWWLSSVAVFGAGVAVLDTAAYGGPLTTGYQPGEVTFAFHAIAPNVRLMPAHLLQAMPVMVLGVTSMAWIVIRWIAARRDDNSAPKDAHRDLWVAVSLGSIWCAMWGLYSTYTWTTDPTSVSIQVVRFYVPALGPIALLGAWLVTRIPGRSWVKGLVTAAVTAAMFTQGTLAFHAMYAAFGVPLS
jgi:hypothetical protein